MEDMIRKSQVLNRMQFRRTEIENNRKFTALKRKTLTGCIDELIGMVNEISPDEALQEETEEAKEPEVIKIQKDKYLEPIMVGSAIGIERYRCWRCNTVVQKEDLFCRRCGSEFGETVDRKNTKWDTSRNRPVGREAG